MLSSIWFSFLYQPLFNALILIYSQLSDKNLGWAVIWLTIGLRVVLLPLSIISERDAAKKEKVEEAAKLAAKAYKGDVVVQNEEIRKIMKKNRVSPWAKVITLLIQLLVLVVLYQVFIRGISGERMFKTLYSWVEFPGKINTNFYGAEIGLNHNVFWAGLAAIYLLLSIYVIDRKKKWNSASVTFLFIFPLFTFVALWILPMVKSLFILTTMIFSDIVTLLRIVFFSAKTTNK